jgi:hypothetical protein
MAPRRRLKRALRQRLAATPQGRARLAERRRRRLLTALLVLVLLLWIDCPRGAWDGLVRERPLPKPRPPLGVASPLPAPRGQARPRMERGAVAAPDWVDSLRLQVGARSTRLATCFEGHPAPGAIRWEALVEPASGAASDHAFSPHGSAGTLPRGQAECLARVLAEPRYKLRAAHDPLPLRVSLVIEF